MAFSAPKSLQGFERYAKVTDQPVLLVPGDPGVTFTRGDRIAMSGGVAILASDSSADTIGICTKTIVCPAATQAFPIAGPGGAAMADLDGDAAKTLIPVLMDVDEGVQITRGKFANHQDETVVSYSAANRYIELTTGLGTDDYGIGALVYVYEGPGKGELNVVEDYDHTGGTVELMLTLHRPFNATLTTASKVLILTGKNAASDGRSSVGGRMDLDTVSQYDMDDGYDDGNFVTFMDFLDAVQHIRDYQAVLGIKAGALLSAV